MENQLFNLFNSSLPFLEFQGNSISFKQTLNLINKSSENFKKMGFGQNQLIEVICRQHPQTIIDIFAIWNIGSIPVLFSDKEPLDLREKKKLSLQSFKDFLPQSQIIFFTTGSQGQPKAVIHTLENLLTSAQTSIDFYAIDSTDRYISSLPLHHVGGAMISFRSLLAHCTCIFPEKNVPYEKYDPTILSLVPTQFMLLQNQPFLKKAKAILMGGDVIPDSIREKIRSFPISLTYGLTESAAQIAASRPFDDKMEILPGREVKISPDGLIMIKGSMGRYLGTNYSQDFFITSDKGKIEKNYLMPLGRVDNTFICGGENISPAEIENAVLSIQDVIYAKVIPMDDNMYGKIPILFFQSQGEIVELEILQQLKVRLPVFKIPKHIIRIKNNDHFKFSLQELKNIYEAQLS